MQAIGGTAIIPVLADFEDARIMKINSFQRQTAAALIVPLLPPRIGFWRSRNARRRRVYRYQHRRVLVLN
jgi:hypothetical protein